MNTRNPICDLQLPAPRAPLALWVLGLSLLLAACATPPARLTGEPLLSEAPISAVQLLEANPLGADAAAADLLAQVASIDVLELSPDMRDFADHAVRGERDEYDRLRGLIYAVMGEGTFELVYDEHTRTAEQTFVDQRGNCLSFTNLFIALARHVGLDARYQEIDVPPDWSLSGQSFLISRHVNVLVTLESGNTQLVDFNLYDFKIRHERKIISDRRGRAHYFNNLGVEAMLGGASARALAFYRASLAEDAGFSSAWINLGILLRRDGHPDYAEAAYLKALELEPASLVGMSNLANLYLEQGQTVEAELYRQKVLTYRTHNPYYRYLVADDAYVNGDYRAAEGHLEFALEQRPDEDRFLALMGMTQLMLGDREAAREWMQKAEAAASRDADRLRYQQKLSLLLNQPAASQR